MVVQMMTIRRLSDMSIIQIKKDVSIGLQIKKINLLMNLNHF